MFGDYKYKPRGNNQERIPDFEPKGCLIKTLIVVVSIIMFVLLGYIFGWS
jgi:hypothetical protein